MDGLFLRQVWSGNDALLESLARQTVAGGRRRRYAALLPDQQGPMVAPRSQQALRPRRTRQAGIRQLLSGWRHQRRSAEVAGLAVGKRQDRRHRVLHDHSPRPRRPLHVRTLLDRVSRRAGARRVAPARGGATDDAADPQELSHQPRRCIHLERLLRERRRVDGARRVNRTDDRPVRGLRGRVVQLQGCVRSIHHGPRRSRVEEAAGLRRRAAGARERAPHRRRAEKSHARRARPNQGRQRRLYRRRREPRRADGGLQPPQR